MKCRFSQRNAQFMRVARGWNWYPSSPQFNVTSISCTYLLYIYTKPVFWITVEHVWNKIFLFKQRVEEWLWIYDWGDLVNTRRNKFTHLTLKAPSKICSRRQIKLFFLYYFSEKISFYISCESLAKQTIHMKCKDLFSLKKWKKILMSSAAVVIGTFRVETRDNEHG